MAIYVDDNNINYDGPSFYTWETVDFEIKLNNPDDSEDNVLSGFKNLIISFLQRDVFFEKTEASPDIGIDDENDIIVIHLSQEETGLFSPNYDVALQVNVLFDDSERDTSSLALIRVKDNLHKGVMS